MPSRRQLQRPPERLRDRSRLHFGIERQVNPQLRSLSISAMHLDPAVESLDNGPGDRQSQTRASAMPITRPVASQESIEDKWNLLHRDTGAVAGDLNDEFVPPTQGRQVNGASISPVPGRIVDHNHHVLLETSLPGLDGHQTLARLRAHREELPILMLTARHNIHDKVSALEARANDHLAKPFVLEELVARIRAMTRRSDQV